MYGHMRNRWCSEAELPPRAHIWCREGNSKDWSSTAKVSLSVRAAGTGTLPFTKEKLLNIRAHE